MRHFEIKNKPYGENNGWRKNALVHCHKCGQDTFLPVQASGGGMMPDEVIHKRFMEAGWALSKNGGQDVCPECVKNVRASLPHREPANEPKVKTPEHIRIATGHVVDAPKEMGRDERRIIYAKLEDTYADEKTGYTKGWSDHRVAQDLGVPRVWIEKVRSEMFGSIATDPDTQAFLGEVEEKLAELKNVFEECAKIKRLIDKFTMEHGPTIARFVKLADCVESLEKKANEIRKRGM